MRTELSAGVIIYRINNNNLEYLLLHHTEGHWDFPKGKLEANETVEQAAVRELREEAGIDADLIAGFQHVISYQFTDKNGELVKKQVVFFLGQVEDAMVVISHEHQDFLWLSYDEAYQKVTYDSAREVFELAHKEVLHHI